MDRIVLLGCDPETEGSLSAMLGSFGHEPVPCRDLTELVNQLPHGRITLVVAKVGNKNKTALVTLKQITDIDAAITVLFLGPELGAELVVELMRAGADDCLSLPCPPETIGVRIQESLQRAKERAMIRKVEYEKLCLEVENHQIMNWRAMYASKEIVQTEHLIHEMATSFNSSGGYEWLDLLQSMVVAGANGNMEVPKEVYDLIIESAGSQRKFFDFVTFLSRLDRMVINKDESAAVQFVVNAEELALKLLKTHCDAHFRPFRTSFPEHGTWIHGYVCQDMALLERCLRELIINAIKYSPEGTALVAGIDVHEKTRMPILNLWVRNQPKQYQAKDSSGECIVGIPRDYSELVFDLFYTIEAYPNKLPEEEWTDGAGLYIARKLLRRQGAWLSTVNGVDYSSFKAEPFIKFNISIPLHAKRDLSKCNPKCSPCPFMLLKTGAG